MGFSRFYVTNKGRSLLAKSQIGLVIPFTRTQIGTGSLQEGVDIEEVVKLVTPLKYLPIAGKDAGAKSATIKAQLSNSSMDAFYWRELGLFATDPDEGEILYAYANAGSDADYIPAGSASKIDFTFGLVLEFGNATQVSVTIDQSLVFATLEGLKAAEERAKAASRPVDWMPTAAEVGAAEVDLSNVANADFKTKAESAGAAGQKIFDQVIRTQVEFEALIASPTWLNAVSVCFIGDGGTLKFTKSEDGIKIPQTVKQIQGMNSATIEMTGFTYNDINRASLWYETLPTTDDYWLDGIIVSCAGTGATAFSNCTNLSHCTGRGSSSGGGDPTGCGFYNCTRLSKCKGIGIGNQYGHASGFRDCIQLSNCDGEGVASTYRGISYGFRDCTQLSICTGTGSETGGEEGIDPGKERGYVEGYGFYDCACLEACMAGEKSPITALFGGENDRIGATLSDVDMAKWEARDSVAEVQESLVDHTDNTTIHVTQADKTAWSAKETPTGAQAKSDAVQTNLTAHTGNKNNPHGVTAAQAGAANVSLSSVSDANFKSKAVSANVAGEKVYDQVIRTQAEFEALIASPTWLDAVSVCFIGNGGTLKFTRSDGQGCKIPQTVKQIQGMNSATIEVTNFVYNATTNQAGLWYETLPTTHDYLVDGLSVNCIGTSVGENDFRNCINLTNCIGSGRLCFSYCTNLTNCIGSGSGSSCVCFSNCTNLTNCIGSCTGSRSGNAFDICTKLTNCTGSGSGPISECSGFRNSTQLTNCTGTGNNSSVSGGYGFKGCTQLGNCTGTGIGGGGDSTGYSFYNCSYLNGCKQGATASTTAFLGGTNTRVDTNTVAALKDGGGATSP